MGSWGSTCAKDTEPKAEESGQIIERNGVKTRNGERKSESSISRGLRARG